SRSASSAITSQTSTAEVLANGLDRTIDLLVAVGERDEQRLELRRRDVDPTRQQVAEERRVRLRVARRGVLEATHRLGAAEEREHCADPLDAAERHEPGLERRPSSLELLVDERVAEPAEDGQPGRGRERVPGERAGLVDLAGGRELLHQVRPAAESGQRQ